MKAEEDSQLRIMMWFNLTVTMSPSIILSFTLNNKNMHKHLSLSQVALTAFMLLLYFVAWSCRNVFFGGSLSENVFLIQNRLKSFRGHIWEVLSPCSSPIPKLNPETFQKSLRSSFTNWKCVLESSWCVFSSRVEQLWEVLDGGLLTGQACQSARVPWRMLLA